MSAILIISIFLIFVASFALLRTKRSPSNESSDYLPPGISPAGLFGDSGGNRPVYGDDGVDDSLKKASEAFEKNLSERAARGELEVLSEAKASGNAALYSRTLDALTEHCAKSAPDLRDLAKFITGHDELRANATLVARLLEVWKQEPTRGSTVELVRVAALSDDAAAFEFVLDAILCEWKSGSLINLSAEELRSLFEGEYWLLASGAKSSGAGFALKQKLAEARRMFSAKPRRENPPTDGELPKEISAQRERL